MEDTNVKSTTENGHALNGIAERNIIDDDDPTVTVEDPLCSAKTAKKVTFQDVTTAAFLIKGGVECTPCTV